MEETVQLSEDDVVEAVERAFELAGRLDVTQAAISELEYSDDARGSTLHRYLEALSARLERVAVFTDADRRVPSHPGGNDAV